MGLWKATTKQSNSGKRENYVKNHIIIITNITLSSTDTSEVRH